MNNLQECPLDRRGRRKLRLGFAGILALGSLIAGGHWMSFLEAAKAKAKSVASPMRVLTAAELKKTDLGQTPASDWAEPPVLKSENGKLETTLKVAYAKNFLDVGTERKWLWLRSYNGMLTGPTLRVKPGDTLKVHLVNDLPGPEQEMVMKEGECAQPTHGFNVTNLHTHGLHISPKEPGDNVLVKVGPGHDYPYKFEILPAGNPGPEKARQYPGTFWYHAHNHGSTAMQLASGMSGALIVEGDIDEVPEIKAARERLFLFQQLAYNDKGEVEEFKEIEDEWSTGQRHTIINGRVKPRFKMRPGEVERWRFIDSGIFEDLPVTIRPAQEGGAFKMYRIAIDGITPPKSEEVASVELGPGYRVDLLVKAPAQKGTYYLYKQPSLYSLSGKKKSPGVNNEQILAEIEVEGEDCVAGSTPSCATQIPVALPAPTDMLPDIPKPKMTREIKFKVVNADLQLFSINNTCYDHNKPIAEPTVGDVEEWTVSNLTEIAHPFHIHVNAFQIVDAQGNPQEWHDTIMVPPFGKVKFRTRFERFDGEFVLHCHILTHEDSGMMQLVRVKPKAP